MKKFVIVALIAAILVGGMIMVSCANPACPGDGKCETPSSLLDILNEFTNCYWSNSVNESDCLPGSTSKCACR